MMCKIELGTCKLYKGEVIKANTCMCIMYPVLLEKEPNTKDPDDAGNTSSEALVTPYQTAWCQGQKVRLNLSSKKT